MKNQDILAQIDAAFKKANTILLTASENLDGDALGCMLALDDFAKSLGKDSTIVNGKSVSDFYSFLGVGDRVMTEIPDKPYDLIMVCDTGAIEMIGRLYHENRALFDRVPLVNIDHHFSDYGTICYTDSEVTSACDIVADFIEYSGGEHAITQAMATYLLLGIIYDSGSYRNSNTTAPTFTSSARLMSFGADIRLIVRGMFQSMSVNRAKLFGEALCSVRSLGGGVGVGAIVTREMLAKYEIDENSIGNVLINDYIRGIDGRFVLLLKEASDGFHLSFRSKDPELDMREVSGLFGGGGHKMASGGITKLSAEEIFAQVEAWIATKK